MQLLPGNPENHQWGTSRTEKELEKNIEHHQIDPTIMGALERLPWVCRMYPVSRVHVSIDGKALDFPQWL